jgi:hypothetical protein
MHTLHIKGTE